MANKYSLLVLRTFLRPTLKNIMKKTPLLFAALVVAPLNGALVRTYEPSFKADIIEQVGDPFNYGIKSHAEIWQFNISMAPVVTFNSWTLSMEVLPQFEAVDVPSFDIRLIGNPSGRNEVFDISNVSLSFTEDDDGKLYAEVVLPNDIDFSRYQEVAVSSQTGVVRNDAIIDGNYGLFGTATLVASVPEPSSVLMAFLGLTSTLLRRRR